MKANLNIFWRVGCILGIDGALIDVIGCLNGRVFQDLTFRRGVQQVGINTKRRFAALVFGDWDLVFLGKIDQLGTACKIPFTPGGDDFDIGVQCVGGQLKPHLVIAFAGRAMGNSICPFELCNLNQAFGDQWARNGGTQQVQTLIKRIGSEHREHKIADKFFTHILDID